MYRILVAAAVVLLPFAVAAIPSGIAHCAYPKRVYRTDKEKADAKA